MRHTLRVMDHTCIHECGEVLITRLPVVLRGTLPRLNRHCYTKGYTWKKSSNIFGGYYIDPTNGNCYFIT